MALKLIGLSGAYRVEHGWGETSALCSGVRYRSAGGGGSSKGLSHH